MFNVFSPVFVFKLIFKNYGGQSVASRNLQEVIIFENACFMLSFLYP